MRLVLVRASPLMVLAACGGIADGEPTEAWDTTNPLHGDRNSLADGEAYTWATLDAAGALAELGVTITTAAIASAQGGDAVHVTVPALAHETTSFDHVVVTYHDHPHGHRGAYDEPHFHVHLYGIDLDVRMTIECDNEPLPAPDRIPEPYFVPSTEAEPEGTCLRGSGVHALDPNAPGLAHGDPASFTHAILIGYHAGEFAFEEAMVAKALLQAEEPFSHEVRRPEVVAGGGLWPTHISGRRSSAAEAYDFVFSGFVAD